MSDKSIKRSVWNRLAPVFGIAAALGFRSMDAATGALDDTKKMRFRNNFAQKAEAKIKKVHRWRKRNRIAKRSRMINRRHA